MIVTGDEWKSLQHLNNWAATVPAQPHPWSGGLYKWVLQVTAGAWIETIVGFTVGLCRCNKIKWSCQMRECSRENLDSAKSHHHEQNVWKGLESALATIDGSITQYCTCMNKLSKTRKRSPHRKASKLSGRGNPAGVLNDDQLRSLLAAWTLSRVNVLHWRQTQWLRV